MASDRCRFAAKLNVTSSWLTSAECIAGCYVAMRMPQISIFHASQAYDIAVCRLAVWRLHR